MREANSFLDIHFARKILQHCVTCFISSPLG
jgi:hypothetical protein